LSTKKIFKMLYATIDIGMDINLLIKNIGSGAVRLLYAIGEQRRTVALVMRGLDGMAVVAIPPLQHARGGLQLCHSAGLPRTGQRCAVRQRLRGSLIAHTGRSR
jgi:hypothetical protein